MKNMGDGSQESLAIDLSHLREALFSSSTKRRGAGLVNLQQQIEDEGINASGTFFGGGLLLLGLSQKSSFEVVNILFRTYPYYNDRNSRRSVEACLQSFLEKERYSSTLPTVLDLYYKESSKLSLAPSNAFVLVEWGSILLSRARESLSPELSLALARVLELCLSSAKHTVKCSAIVVTRRAVRKLLANGPTAVATLVGHLTAKDQPLGFRTAVLLGVIAGVCARKSRSALPKKQYYNFYVREFLGSRTAIPAYIATALNEFFESFTTVSDLHQEILPTLEKALLRAPEVVLDLIPPMVQSLPSEVDLAEILAKHLLKPLLADAKTQNPKVREGALSAFTAFMSHAREEKSLELIGEEISVSFSKLTVVEQRIVHAQMLAQMPYLASQPGMICQSLAKAAGKEPNESALSAEIIALGAQYAQFIWCSYHQEVDKSTRTSISEAFSNGLSNKKPGARKIWALSAGEVLSRITGLYPQLALITETDGDQTVETSITIFQKTAHNADRHKRIFDFAGKYPQRAHDWLRHSQPVVLFVESVAPKLLQAFDEVAQNPLIAGPLSVVAFVTMGVSVQLRELVDNESLKNTIRKARFYERALANPKTSLLLNHRVYAKLTNYEDLIWVIRALMACSPDLAQTSADIRDAWAQVFLYLITATTIPPPIQKEAIAALAAVYTRQRVLIAETVIKAIWTWYGQIEASEKDSAACSAKTGTSLMYLVVNSICPPRRGSRQRDSNTDILETQLVNMLVLCRPEILPRVHWIETCLKVGQDPGSLVSSKPKECLDKINSYLTWNQDATFAATVQLAAYNTAAELAFVAPDDIIPLLNEQIRDNLPSNELRACGPTEIAIARTPEGTAFVDVLSAKAHAYSIDKKSKDYDTMKWEEEIRSQIARKKGQERKLTADEKAKVNEQLAKEAIIRRDVRKLEGRLKTGIGLVQALAVGPPVQTDLWLGKSLKALTEVITIGVGRLVGAAADEAYLECSKFMAHRLGSSRRFIGVATLRALGSSTLPAELFEEPLGDLVTRLLYRLRFSSEQRPFDNVSLMYLLPLIFVVLRQRGVARSVEDEADEQITLALEIVSYHTDACRFPFLLHNPRVLS